MAEEATEAAEVVVSAVPTTPPKRSAEMDPLAFITAAREAVVTAHNETRNRARGVPALTFQDTHLVWFCKTLQNWKAIISSPVVKRMLWEVTCNGYREELYVDAYLKLTNTKVTASGEELKS